jgi:hypothetical protein
MRDFLGLSMALGIAVAGGYLLTDRALATADQLSRQEAGIWHFWPRAGSTAADPYLRAITARRAILPMALGEGIGLVAERDSSGETLSSECSYRLAGRVPGARVMTLSAYDPDGQPFKTIPGRTVLTSDEVLRDEQGQFTVDISARPMPGNWLPLSNGAQFTLVLRLYDTPLGANAAALTEAVLPTVTRISCP